MKNDTISSLPNLIQDFSTWKILEMDFSQGLLRYVFDGNEIASMSYIEPFCNIDEISLYFKGAGALDWVKVINESGMEVYFEDFLDCNNIQEPLPCTEADPVVDLENISNCTEMIYTMNVTNANSTVVYYVKGENGTSYQTKDTFMFSEPGDYEIGMISGCPAKDTSFLISWDGGLALEVENIQAKNCDYLGLVNIKGAKGKAPYEYKLDNALWLDDGYFTDLAPGIFKVYIKDANECIDSTEIEILDQSSVLEIVMDSSELKVDCVDTSNYIAVSATGSDPYHYFIIDNEGEFNTTGFFENLSVGTHKISCVDDFGCSSEDFIFEITAEDAYGKIELDTSICKGDSLKWGNMIFKEAGSFTDTVMNPLTCDTIYLTNLAVNDPTSFTQDISICENETFIIGNNVYSESGEYEDVMVNQFGCDSIVTTNLTVTSTSEFSISDTICLGDTLWMDNTPLFEKGEYNFEYANSLGCDSIVTLDLQIRDNSNEVIITDTICPGDTAFVENTAFVEEGEYSFNYQSIHGCDSMVFVNIVERSFQACNSIDCSVYFPNVFSPNGDGVNEYFEPLSKEYKSTLLIIFDRWGNKVFESTTETPKWDGRMNGKEVAQGVYVFVAMGTCGNSERIKKLHGNITLIR